MGGCMGGWVDQWVNGWVNGWGHVISLKIEQILKFKIIQFCLKICDLLRHPHLWIGGWVDGWSMAGARWNTKYRINLDLIERIQLCLKIYDGSMGGSMGR